MNTESKEIKVADIAVSKMNPRTIVKKDLKNSSLRQSIKENGIQMPIGVHLMKDGKYGLMYGERRLTCAKELKMDTVPALVHSDMTEEEIYDKMHFENASREDLTPMEMAKDAQNLMKVYKGDVKAVAAKLGVSEREARMRTKLNKLSKEWTDALNGDDSEYDGIRKFTVSHLALISRLEKDMQDQLLNSYWQIEDRSVAKLEEFINDRVSVSLDNAKFDTEQCKGCLTRSDAEEQMGLWSADNKEDIVLCLNTECYRAKEFDMFFGIHDSLKEKYPNLIVLVREYNVLEKIKETGLVNDVRYDHTVEPAKKSDEGSMPALAYGKKTVKWVKGYDEPSSSKSSRPVDPETGKAVPKTMKERKQDLKGLRVKLALESLVDVVRETDTPALETIQYLASLCSALSSTIKQPSECNREKIIKSLVEGKKMNISITWETSKNMNLADVLWYSCRGDLASSVKPANGPDALEKEKWGKYVANMIGFDFKAALKQAEIDKPEPKSWANLNKDGTKKK